MLQKPTLVPFVRSIARTGIKNEKWRHCQEAVFYWIGYWYDILWIQ